MFNRCWVWGITLGAMLITQGALAFPCFITIIKDNCWTHYTVTIDVLDADTQATLTTIVVPKGESWSRGRFDGQPKQHLMVRAKFKPIFWKASVNKIYYAKHYWLLPDAGEGKTTAFNINICYPKSFSSVPLPPEANSKCICSEQNLPRVSDI